MFRWAHPEHLYALLALPGLIALFYLSFKKRSSVMEKLGDPNLVSAMNDHVSSRKPMTKAILSCLSFILLVIAWANPQIGSRLEEVKREGVDIMIALDVSNSMLAEDIKPNRLERSKQFISRLIDKLDNDRIGIVVFAGKAYVQLPITTDYGAAKLFLSTIDPAMIPTQGTAIGDAIELCEKSFKSNDKKSKTIIVITDGENHEDDAVAAAKSAAESGTVIHTVGMGSSEGTPIPVNRNGSKEFLTDNDGQTVITRLDETTLQIIAAESKGIYVRPAQGEDEMKALIGRIGKMEKRDFGTKQYTDYEDRFQYFLGLAIILLIIETTMGERKSFWLRKLKLFETDEQKSV